MSQVFKTNPESPDDVTIVGVGVLGSRGRGGVPVKDAADSMSELQDDDGAPLTGGRLTTAARKFAEARGFTVATVDEASIPDLPREMGTPPDRPPASEVAEQEYAATYSGLDPVGDDADALSTGEPVAAGVPAPAPTGDTTDPSKGE